MSTRDVGELPSYFTERQRQEIRDIMENRPGPGFRLLRDKYLHYIDRRSYYSRDVFNQPNAYGRDMELLRTAYLNESRYYSMLLQLVDEYVDRLDMSESNEGLIDDLMNPRRIPNEYNSRSRSRVRDIMTALYRTNREEYTAENISPYELLMQLSTTDYSGGSASIYIGRYMGQYPMIVKDIMNADISRSALIHEYIVGIVMNRLRADIPSYVYTYGLTRRTLLLDIGSDAYYTRDSRDTYTLCIEHIDNAIQMSRLSVDQTATVSVEGIVKYYERSNLIRLLLFQILCAMTYAYSKVGFIHRDMHGNNILIVTLPEIMAIPVMVPVSYRWTDDSRIADIQFERRWILSNLMVMIIDYGLSTVRSVHLDSSLYRHDLIVSPSSIYLPYEGISGFENDLAILILSVSRLSINLYLDDYREDVNSLSRDYLRILYRMYTGDTLAEDQVNERQYFAYYNTNIDPDNIDTYYYQTHPHIRYDPYGAVIEYCNRYKDMFITDDYTGYINVLSRSNDRDSRLTTIDSTRSYYWYDKYSNRVADVSISRDSIEENDWFRRYRIAPIMPSDVYIDADQTNDEVIDYIYNYLDDNDSSYVLIDAIYRYIQYFNQFSLNIQPLSYNQPTDLLRDLEEKVREIEGDFDIEDD